MKDESGFGESFKDIADAVNAALLGQCFDGLSGFSAKVGELDSALATLAEVGDKATRQGAQRLRRQLAGFEPSVTMIGQVKSGKTSVVNAMIGRPGLLPADVNPWTSVVTSLHLDPAAPHPASKATFRFFDGEEWSRLLEKGGRVGELAQRAGAEDEYEKIRAQVEAMREKSRARLGRRFELLLGQEHDYDGFDEELIERYVCLGDYFGPEETPAEVDQQGRFADITKSADLVLQRTELPLKLCIRDTPGVNDTFMMREQITIRAIRDSRICVMVLSAHQALSSVDMALIRLISNIRAREVVIFVNRIDELSDPARQVPEIRDSIRATLRAHEGPEDAQIIFGSAYWALHALSDQSEGLDPESRQALLNWAEANADAAMTESETLDVIWRLSGIPALYAALGERIAAGPGQELIDRVARSTANLAEGLQAASRIDLGGITALGLTREAVNTEMDRITYAAHAALESRFNEAQASYHVRLNRSHQNFLERSSAALIAHLEAHGDGTVWTYDPTGLRMLLRTGYQVFGAKVQRAATTTCTEAAERIGALYQQAFCSETPLEVKAPPPPRVAPPVVIGQTIALDIKGTWWSSWWKRLRGYKSYAETFHKMLKAETDPIVEDLKTTQIEGLLNESRALLDGLMSEQRELILGLFDRYETGTAATAAGTTGTEGRLAAVTETIASLTRDAA